MGILYVVATPIGNLGDISARALEIFRMCDLVVCEDTRETRKILSHARIETKVTSLNEHASDAALARVVEELRAGKNIAYATDAGTPAISDPGGKLVELVHAAGITVSPIPGPSSVMAALSVAGFPANEFQFLGYFPRKKGRQTLLARLNEIEMTTVFFESPFRVKKLLEDLAQALPETREILVARELTKKFEEILRGPAQKLVSSFADREPKGEFVIVIGPRK